MPSCTKVAAFARNKSRKLPPFHAKDCLKKRKQGNDGRLYIAKKVRGVCRWILDDDEEESAMVVYRPRSRAVTRRTSTVSRRKTPTTKVYYLNPTPRVAVVGYPYMHILGHNMFNKRASTSFTNPADRHTDFGPETTRMANPNRNIHAHEEPIAGIGEFTNRAGVRVRDMPV